MELANKVPPDLELVDIDKAIKRAGEEAHKKGYKDTPVVEDGRTVYLINEQAVELIEEAVRECMEGLPPDSRPYFGEISFFDDGLLAADRYRRVREVRDSLRRIIRVANQHLQDMSTSLEDFAALRTTSYMSVDEHGRIYLRKDELAEAVEGVEAARIRECEVCKRIFWAGRIDQRGCSLRCNDILRKRRYRARYKQKLQSAESAPVKQDKPITKRKQVERGK